jgi:hypothetical protein
MHTDATLDILSSVTTSLGHSLRTFEEKSCGAFETRELERERAARQQRQEKSAANGASKSKRPTAPNSSKARKPKGFNLMTYKFHALGDYVDNIRRFGTTDSYSTQPVSVYMVFCVILLTVVVGIRANSSTEHPKLGHFGLVADQYHSK